MSYIPPIDNGVTDGTTTPPTKVAVIAGKTNDGTPEYQSLPEGPGGRSVIVEGVAGGVAIPISGTVTSTGGLTDAELRATPVPVSGTVTATGPLTDVQLRATPVPVSGTVTATGPLTDTQLRATPVPVSGTVTTGGLTDTQLRATPVPVSGTVTAVTGGLTDTQLRASPVPVSLASAPTTSVTQGTSPWIVAGGGTAGTAASGVATIQGIASMTPVQVSQATGTNLHAVIDTGSTTAVTGNVTVVQTTGTNLHTVIDSGTVALSAGSAVIGHVITDATSVTAATLSAETTKVIGVTRTADGAGNLLTSNSTTPTAKFSLDHNITSILGTAPTTVGKLDVKGADGDVFVRQTTGTNLHVVVDTAPTTVVNGNLTNNNAAPSTNNVGSLGYLANAANPSFTEGNLVLGSIDLSGHQRVILKGVGVALVDGFANTRDFPVDNAGNLLTQQDYLFTYNGSTWDRVRSGDQNNVAAATGFVNDAPVARYNATQPTLTDTRYNLLQVSARGELLVSPGAGGFAASSETSTVYSGTTALTPGKAVIAVSATGTLVALVAAKKIRVLALSLMSNGTVNVKFQSHVTPTDITGLYYLIANTGFVLPYNPVGWFDTIAGEALDINLSGSIAVGGCLTYVAV